MKVKIKTWEQMGKEFGLTKLGNIPRMLFNFTKEMEELLPEDRVIEVRPNPSINGYRWDVEKYVSRTITDEMIEEFLDEPQNSDESVKNSKDWSPYVDTKPVSTSSNPIDPKHYNRYKIEPIEFINANNLNFNVGNAIKYVLGSSTDDLKEAKKYIDFEIKRLAESNKLTKG